MCHFGNSSERLMWHFLTYEWKSKKYWGQTISFELVKNSCLQNLFIKCLWLHPSAYLRGWKWINRIISKLARGISKFLFILGLYKFLEYLEYIISFVWSFGHSDPYLSRVKKQTYLEKLDINDVASIFASKDARTFSFHFEFHSVSSPFQSLNCYAMANINHIYIIYRQNNIVDPKPEIWNQLLINFDTCTLRSLL